MKVIIADDHALFRDGIASLLKVSGMEVVGQASNGLEALELARELRPDIVLMDIKMPEHNGLEATRLIKAEMPDVTVVIVTVSDEEEDLFEAIKSGAQGYLLKNISGEEFGRMLQAIANGDAPLSSGLAAKVLGEFARLGQQPPSRESAEDELSERERQVLEKVAAGATNKEIAASLVISENTVNYHMKNILAKLHLRNRAQAVAYAVRTGLLKLAPK